MVIPMSTQYDHEYSECIDVDAIEESVYATVLPDCNTNDVLTENYYCNEPTE